MGRDAGEVGAAPVDDLGLVDVLEVAVADALQQRRRRGEERGGGALLDGRAALDGGPQPPVCRCRFVAIAPGMTAFQVVPSSRQWAVAATANRMVAVVDRP
ncbi:hypothetical protein [Geodermatophilus saharensis]|uniref:hypothetical protein n=1 Tax=Geodermatophilus saharensis TaxID=1137994 RepID=UPI000B78DC68|nr:hypothetical protein [Geodermatophilus saharensis]